MAYARLALAYGNLGQPSLAAENLKKAYALRDRVSEREKFHISADYYAFVTGELEKEAQTYQLWMQSYPRDSIPHSNLGANYTTLANTTRRSRRPNRRIASGPERLWATPTRPMDLALDRFPEARAARQGAGPQPRGLVPAPVLLLPGLPEQRHGADGAQVAGARGNRERKILCFPRSLTPKPITDVWPRRGTSPGAPSIPPSAPIPKRLLPCGEANAALREAEFGNVAAAKQGVAAALALAPGRDVKLLAALALARTGETARAQSHGGGTGEEQSHQHRAEALLAADVRAGMECHSENQPRPWCCWKPLRLTNSAEPPPLQVGTLYPAYLRGQAYLLAHNGSAAARRVPEVSRPPRHCR